ncbi:class I SAM-dependent methyltransferase [Streptomyces pinistramenti]|uniref:class I SAM-dependent methyltransferase n=1 Tax=Streptomyces pinistramenti TaxID=2884812 RepID=UPI001D0819B3|nr:class I SAM-dependent methyltransferase [Streptomyces pinistramenti]MCB5906164.1 class I SAM-dependent methyltransferase [Streptomyces pinistramenti]
MPSTPSELFASAAPYYARCQPLYPQELYDSLTQRFALDGTQTALDLGCGPGTIALPLSRLVDRVIAVDPEPGMLEQGQLIAQRQNFGNIQWRQGDSSHLRALNLPPLDLCIMGRAFHWMSREQVLADLDPLVNHQGGVATTSMQPPDTEWARIVADVRDRYLIPSCCGDNGTYREQEESHREILLRSPFPCVTAERWTYHVDHTLDELVGLQFSHSSFTPARLGDRKDAFEQDLRTALGDFNPSGHFGQTICAEALIATRRH